MANSNYSRDRDTQENFNTDGKYDLTGESEFSRDSSVPFDEDEVLTERHYNFDSPLIRGREIMRSRASAPAMNRPDYRGRGPRGYRRSDESIREDVSEALYRNSEVDASEIEVFVADGRVTLKGTVKDRNQKREAESAIENLVGVDDVFNELRIAVADSSPPRKSKGLVEDNITGMN
ncbi:BON domain-containing protein [Peredibacter starrii]|uniref:BON domain-containing protein n=1 Tax=Peredibacter starrii TaxID=28202 RepID=A0AAX4HUW2_9BACT|nr:BON domain-containing protein [Peredibacter starrii]WPU66965.1 BON domain-containing protein [Peredibacter starrii]